MFRHVAFRNAWGFSKTCCSSVTSKLFSDVTVTQMDGTEPPFFCIVPSLLQLWSQNWFVRSGGRETATAVHVNVTWSWMALTSMLSITNTPSTPTFPSWFWFKVQMFGTGIFKILLLSCDLNVGIPSEKFESSHMMKVACGMAPLVVRRTLTLKSTKCVSEITIPFLIKSVNKQAFIHDAFKHNLHSVLISRSGSEVT